MEIQPPKSPPSIDDVRVMSPRDYSDSPWPTKAGGKLDVICALNALDIEQFFGYREEDVGITMSQADGFDIRGMRLYLTYDVPVTKSEDMVGGHEFHKIRHELLVTIGGYINWTLEDLHGATRKVDLPPMHSLWVPPWILHTSRVLEPPATTLVVANTLFDQRHRLTADAYPAREFYALQSVEA